MGWYLREGWHLTSNSITLVEVPRKESKERCRWAAWHSSINVYSYTDLPQTDLWVRSVQACNGQNTSSDLVRDEKDLRCSHVATASTSAKVKKYISSADNGCRKAEPLVRGMHCGFKTQTTVPASLIYLPLIIRLLFALLQCSLLRRSIVNSGKCLFTIYCCKKFTGIFS